ncbi:MAG: alkaline phosphatase family protein [Chloroflexi bacterium]|nr:alkaline phosphatase family protein [Chloroflexota bacterium]
MPDPLAKSFYRRFRESNMGLLRRVAPLLLASVLIIAAGLAPAYLLVRWYDSLAGYRSPLAKYPAPGESGDAVVPQVVLVVIDGLREDVAAEMPVLQRLRRAGASASVIVPFPFTRPAWTTLVTGAEPDINDAPLLDPAAERARAPAPESLFVTVHRANLNTAIAARPDWQPLVSVQSLSESYFSSEADLAVADQRANDAAIGFLRNFAPNFLLVHYALPAQVAQSDGATSDAYRRAALQTDQLLGALAAELNLRQTAIAVTTGHGYTDAGGHGGGEPAAARVPLVLTGARIKPGELGAIRQSDIAPTLAALAGGSIPNASQGSVLFGALDITDAQRAAKALALAQQQRDFGAAYLATIGGQLSDNALNDALVARSSFEVKNYGSTYDLASLNVVQIQHDIDVAQTARIGRERVARLPLVLVLAFVPLVIFWWRRGLPLAGAGLIALGMVTVQHFLYLQAGHAYSFSDVQAIPLFLRGFAERGAAALAFGGLLVIILHWRDPKPSRTRVAVALISAAAIAVFFLAVPALYGYYLNGLNTDWYIGDVGWMFTFVFGLAAIAAMALLAAPVAVAIALVYWLSLIIVHRIARLSWIQRIGTRLRQRPDTP